MVARESQRTDATNELTSPELIRWALRWAWQNDVLTQQQVERGLDWIDEHDEAISHLPDQQDAD